MQQLQQMYSYGGTGPSQLEAGAVLQGGNFQTLLRTAVDRASAHFMTFLPNYILYKVDNY